MAMDRAMPIADPVAALAPVALLDRITIGAVVPGGRCGFDGAAMFLDLGGFTAMSERLGRLGSKGTEELVGLLNAFFAPAVDLVRGSGGDVVAFGGDAITAVWTGEDASLTAEASGRGLLGLVGDLSPIGTSAGEVELNARIGVAAGALLCDVVGSTSRRLVVVHGPAVDGAVACEHRAALGTVVADHAPTAPTDGGAATELHVDTLVHPVIADRLRRGDAGLIAAHRRVTTLFAQLGDAASAVDVASRAVAAVEDLDGEVIQITGGDKGTVLLAAFGAPTSDPEDAPRAVAAASAIVAATPGGSVGVSTGTVFAGFIGSAQRGVYTVIGDSVNLAARLMQRAGAGVVVVDEATQRAASRQFAFAPAETAEVKGRSATVEVSEVVARRTRSWPTNRLASDGPLIGRDDELRLCEEVLDDDGARARRLVIAAPPGVGKSRLGRAVCEAAEARGWRVLASGFAGFGDATPYAGWQPILRSILDPRRPTDEAVEAALPGSGQLAPLLGPLIGEPLADNTTTHAMPGEIRSELAEDLAARLLDAASRARPVLVVLEDWHWADDASGRLLETIVSRATDARVVTVVTTRSLELGPTIHPHRFDVVLDLQELDPLAGRELAASAWARVRGRSATSQELNRLVATGGGNPLMLETLTQVDAHETMPPDLATLLQSRLDAFADDELRPLLWASAFVRPFTAAELASALARGGAPADVLAPLDRLLASGVLAAAPLSSDGAVAFRHASLQEAAYERLSHGVRLDVHHSIALCLEDAGAPAVEVAGHLLHTHDRARQEAWYEAAAVEAHGAWSLREACRWMTELIAVARNAPLAANTAVWLAETMTVLGDWDEAVSTLQQHRDEDSARWLRCAGELAMSTGQVDDAIERLTEALRLDADGSGRAADAELLSRALLEAGRFDTAERVLRDALARTGGAEPANRARLLGALGTLRVAQLDLESAVSTLTEALSALGGDEPIRRIHLLGDLAAACALAGSVREALGYQGDARRLATEIGYRRHLAMSQGNEAEIRLLIGHWADALAGAATSLELFDRLGDVGMAADNLLRLISNRDLPARDREAIYEAGIDLEERLDRPHALADWKAAHVELLAETRAGAAATAAADLVAVARHLDRPDLELRAMLTGALPHDLADITRLRFRAQNAGERFLCDVLRRRVEPDRTDDAALIETGRVLYRATPFVSYRDALDELGAAGSPTDVAPAPRESTEDDAAYSLDAVLSIIADLRRRLDQR